MENQNDLINETEFLEEYGDSMEIIEMMLPKFEVGIQESVAKVQNYLSQKEAQQLGEELHSLKGMVGNFYSPILYNLSASMEQSAKQGDLTPIADQLASFIENYPKVLSLVADYVKKHAS